MGATETEGLKPQNTFSAAATAVFRRKPKGSDGEINESVSLINFPQVVDAQHSKDSAMRHYGLRLRMMSPEKPFVMIAAARGIQGI